MPSFFNLHCWRASRGWVLGSVRSEVFAPTITNYTRLVKDVQTWFERTCGRNAGRLFLSFQDAPEMAQNAIWRRIQMSAHVYQATTKAELPYIIAFHNGDIRYPAVVLYNLEKKDISGLQLPTTLLGDQPDWVQYLPKYPLTQWDWLQYDVLDPAIEEDVE
jgi:hypothetical protein